MYTPRLEELLRCHGDQIAVDPTVNWYPNGGSATFTAGTDKYEGMTGGTRARRSGKGESMVNEEMLNQFWMRAPRNSGSRFGQSGAYSCCSSVARARCGR